MTTYDETISESVSGFDMPDVVTFPASGWGSLTNDGFANARFEVSALNPLYRATRIELKFLDGYPLGSLGQYRDELQVKDVTAKSRLKTMYESNTPMQFLCGGWIDNVIATWPLALSLNLRLLISESVSGFEVFRRLLQNSDVRITMGGDTRITQDG